MVILTFIVNYFDSDSIMRFQEVEFGLGHWFLNVN